MKTKTILSQVAARTAHGARLATLLLAAVAAGRAWAIVADDVWELESGLPTSGTQEGANGNYTLTAAGDSTLGATIDLSGVSSLANVSVLVKYTGLSAQSSGYYTLASVQAAASSSSSNVIGWRNSATNALTATGYYVASPLNAYRFDTYSVSNYTYSEGTVPELPESGYFLFTHDISASDYSGTYGTALYAASSLSSLAGGVNRQLKWARDTDSARCITTLSVGGPVAVSSTEAAAVSAWPNVTIEKVALFVGQTLTPSDVASYQFPSEQDYTATITTDTDWDDITWTKDWVPSSDATITVESDATLTIPDTAEIGTLNLVIASGVTLTLANSGTITAISSAGGTLKFTGTATIPALSGSSTLAIDANATLTAGGKLAHAGGTTMGSGAKLTTTAAYGFGTGAFTSDDTTAEVKYVGGGTGTTTLSSAATQFGASTWTGAVRLSATTNGYIYVNQWGNTGSKVIMDGVKCYPVPYDESDSAYNVREIEIASGGWLLYEKFTSKNIVIPAAITGSGTFNTHLGGSSAQATKAYGLTGSCTVFFTGDVSGFSGTMRVNSASDSSGFSRIVFLATANATDNPAEDENCPSYSDQTIAIAKGTTVTVNSAATFAARKGFVVDGELILNGSLIKWTGTVGVLIGGSGTITTPTPSGKNWAPFTVDSGWTGTVVVPSFTLSSGTQCSVKFNSIGNSTSTVVFKGNSASGQFWPVEYNETINPLVQLDGTMYISNGTSTSGAKGTFSRLSGEGDLLIYTYNYCVDVLTNFTGTVGANNANILSINTIALAEDASPAVGDRLVSISQTVTYLDGVDDTVVTIGGEETAIKLEKLYAGTATAGLYVAGVATDGTTSYATVGDAVAVAGETEGTISVSASTENETLAVAGDITLTLADEVTLTVASLSGEGTLTVNVADDYSTGATIVIPKGATIGNITVGTGVTLYVDGEIASGDTLFTLTGDSKTSFETVECVYGTIHVTDTDGVITAGRTYYWAGTASDGNATLITDSTKWSYSDGGSAITDSTYPGTLDTAVFNVKGSGASLSTSTSESFTLSCNVVVKDDFTFHNKVAKTHNIGAEESDTVPNPTFTVEDGATATLLSSGGDKLIIYSKLEGAGTLVGSSTSTNYSCITISGDTSAFEGTVDFRLTSNTQYNRIGNALALDNSLARWCISTNGTMSFGTNNRTPFTQSSSTYKFGSLKAWIANSNKDASNYDNKEITLEIGENIDEDSWVRGSWYSLAAKDTIEWLAESATLTLGITNTSRVVVGNTGSVYFMDSESVPTNITFSANGSLAIDSDNASAAATIVGAIAAPDSAAVGFDVSAEAAADLSSATSFALANGVSFNKKGSGWLTITGAFTSIGTVDVAEEGALVLVVAGDDSLESAITYTCADGTQCTVSDDFMTYTFTLAGVEVEVDDGATVTVPATWLETYGLTSATASDLTADRSDGNGYSYFACYALGLDPTDADSVPLATITSDSDGNFVVGLTGCGTIPDNVSITLSLVSTTDIDDDFAACTPATTSGSGIDTTFTITPSTESSVEFFKVKITIGNAE